MQEVETVTPRSHREKTATLSVSFYLITCWKCFQDIFIKYILNPHFYSDLSLRLYKKLRENELVTT